MNNTVNIFLFDDEKITHTLIESYLSDVTFSYNLLVFDNVNTEEVLKYQDSLNIIIANVSLSDNEILDKLVILKQNKNNHIIIISYEASTDINVKAMRFGAEDFLLKPVVKQDFIYAVQKIYQEFLKNKSSASSSILTVLSAREGEGKTTFIINLAEELSSVSGEEVLIVDFNNSIRDVSMMLNLDISYSLPWFIDNIKDNNQDEIFDKAIKYSDSLVSIVASGMLGVKKFTKDISKLDFFFKKAKERYRYILVDLNPDLEEYNAHVLNKLSDSIYILFENNKDSLVRLKSLMLSSWDGSGVRLILNKAAEDMMNNSDIIEKEINKNIFGKIPFNIFSSLQSYKTRKTLKETNPNMDIVASYHKLTLDIINRD